MVSEGVYLGAVDHRLPQLLQQPRPEHAHHAGAPVARPRDVLQLRAHGVQHHLPVRPVRLHVRLALHLQLELLERHLAHAKGGKE